MHFHSCSKHAPKDSAQQALLQRLTRLQNLLPLICKTASLLLAQTPPRVVINQGELERGQKG